MLIDVAIPGDRNVIKIEAGISKYEDLITEIQRVWNGITKVIALRCVIPVVCVTRWEGEGSSKQHN